MFRTAVVVSSILFLAPFTRANADNLTLTSDAIAEGGKLDSAQVFAGFGCEGENKAPALSWSGAPKNTKSFAITVYDPDAPTGSGWWHWFAFNIPANVTSLAEGGKLPGKATSLKNDYGQVGFGGACPPPGEVHRYQFTIHALDRVLELDASVSNALAGFMVNAHSIASDRITAIFVR